MTERPRDGAPDRAHPDSRTVEAVDRHLRAHLGPPADVLRELSPRRIDVGIHVVPPGEGRPWTSLVTSGMSDVPMPVPAEAREAGASPYAELVMLLPPDWPVVGDPGSPYVWPVALLHTLARLPLEEGSWLGHWHSVPNGTPPAPFAPGVPFVGALLLPPLRLPDEFEQVTTADGRTITFLAVVPVLPDELDVVVREGFPALFDGFRRHEISELLDPDRGSSLRGA